MTGVIPFITVAGARRAIDWYVDALGAELRGEPLVMPDGRIGHSELAINGGVVHVADEAPSSHVAGPRPGEDATVTLGLEVADADAVIERALARGATLERAAADYAYGRNGVIRDPFNHRWLISSAPRGGDRLRTGDAGFASLNVADVERAERFFGAVLGLSYGPRPSGPQGREVIGTSLPQGLWGGQEQSTLFISYVVDDVDAAMARVRAAGGEAGAAQEEAWGRSVDCVDNQGMAFAMHQPRAGAARSRQSVAASKQGDIEYITMHVIDSAKARAFYGAVFGWDFAAGRVADGWNVLDAVPMTGVAGGRDRMVIVPMYRVDDIAGAVQRVRDAGGSATDPERQPYGVTAQCTDDQGTEFYLGER